MNPTNPSTPLLDAICQQGVLIATSVRYWRGCKRLTPEDLGLDPAHVSDRLIQLGHKRLIPRDALASFALIESRTNALVEGASFPFLGGIARYVPNPRIAELQEKLDSLGREFHQATGDFVAGYGPLRDRALTEWREAARNLNGSAARLIATIEQSFPPAGEIARKFAFETRMFQIAAPESIRLELADGLAAIAVNQQRSELAAEATRKLQGDLDGFIRDCVTSLRHETAALVSEVLTTINSSENGVHQRTLNRLHRFIEHFRSLNFAGDQELEETLEHFRRDLLNRSADDYRNSQSASADLTHGLQQLRRHALNLAHDDPSHIVSRFGQVGQRKLAAVG